MIDFIDMTPAGQNQRAVEEKMREALEADRARIQVGRISRFGLLEMSRQRLRPSLGETSGIVCPRCNGQGIIRDVESLSLAILRLIEEEALKDRTAEVRARVPFQVAAFLLNEKRNAITKIELRTRARIFILPDDHLETPHFEVQRLRDDSPEIIAGQASYEMSQSEAEEVQPVSSTRTLVRQEAAVKTAPQRSAPATSAAPAPAEAPVATPAQEPSLFKGLIKSLVGLFAGKAEEPQAAARRRSRHPPVRSATTSAAAAVNRIAAAIPAMGVTRSASRVKSVSRAKNGNPARSARLAKNVSRVKSASHARRARSASPASRQRPLKPSHVASVLREKSASPRRAQRELRSDRRSTDSSAGGAGRAPAPRATRPARRAQAARRTAGSACG